MDLAILRKSYLDVRNQNINKFENKFLQISHKHFEEQKKEVLSNVRSRFKSFKPTKVKANKQNTNNLFDKVKSATKFATALLVAYKMTVVSTGNAAFDYVAGASAAGTSAQFSGASNAIQDFYNQRSSTVAAGIDDTTEKVLKASLTEGLTNGETIDQLANRVESVYNAAAGYRAQAIARTESIDASTFATIDAWQQSGVVSEVTWTVGSDNPCDFCEDMDGTTVDLGDNFFNKGDSLTIGEGDDEQTMNFDYDDVDGPPAHVNCTCSLIPVIAS
jgi:hypothetical protein